MAHIDDDIDQHIQIQLEQLCSRNGFETLDYVEVGNVLQLINPSINENGQYCPQYIILEPDYLVDVTAIAECMQDYAVSPLWYLRKKIEAIPNSRYIRLGNYANRVVDDLLSSNSDSSIDHLQILRSDFAANPIAYSTCFDLSDDSRLKQYVKDAKMHFDTIKSVIEKQLPSLGIQRNTISLEPAFISARFGIQGRLDILSQDEIGNIRIIELKSGSTPFPDDKTSVKINHQAQLYLYYQLVADALNGTSHSQTNIQGYILYSKSRSSPLRFDAPNIQRVGRIFDIRNQIVRIEKQLISDSFEITNSLFEKLADERKFDPSINPKFRSILIDQHRKIMRPIKMASPTELHYFYSFFQFIASEQFMAKTGMGDRRGRSQASLWLKTTLEKEKAFEILDQLVFKSLDLVFDKQVICFSRTRSDIYTNFRVGDICILYPNRVLDINSFESRIDQKNSIHLILKCHIQSITDKKVIVQLRHKQDIDSSFTKYSHWTLELDHMDHSYVAQQRNLHQFLSADQAIKQLVLCQNQPRTGQNSSKIESSILTPDQQRIVQSAIDAPDYFLLNGPPGTGKTSVIIHHIVKHLVQIKKETILLLAFTNKAVDQLCHVLDRIFNDKRQFVRLGKPIDKHESLLKSTLNQRIIDADQIAKTNRRHLNRNDLKQLFDDVSVVVSTVSSIANKSDLLQLLSFDRVIIDEASQLLEPQIIGVLSQVPRFIMIGDHKQLPAVVQQSRQQSAVDDPILNNIGLFNRADSLFERLYTYCERMGYHHAYDQLTIQGRMHRELAAFPSKHFYNDSLSTLAEYLREDDHRQLIPLPAISQSLSKLQQLFAFNRLICIPTQTIEAAQKSNRKEAERICQIVQTIQQLNNFRQIEWNPSKQIGIISPFRNQIALIRQLMLESDITFADQIHIDTVERFQGDEKDIIIVSFSVNNLHELSMMIAKDANNAIDRKLNVTITRAKEQLILLGNFDILQNEEIYTSLFKFIKTNGVISQDFE